jgi:hypothetical protein
MSTPTSIRSGTPVPRPTPRAIGNLSFCDGGDHDDDDGFICAGMVSELCTVAVEEEPLGADAALTLVEAELCDTGKLVATDEPSVVVRNVISKSFDWK